MAKTARAHIDDDVFSVLLQSIADRGNQLMPRREQVSRGRIERLKRTYPRGSGLVDVGSIRRIALAQHSSVSDRERKLCQTPPPPPDRHRHQPHNRALRRGTPSPCRKAFWPWRRGIGWVRSRMLGRDGFHADTRDVRISRDSL